jgi:hypothetical protein
MATPPPKQYSKAEVTALRRSAANGNAESQHQLGLAYAWGIPHLVRHDWKTAAALFGEAAAQEHAEARYWLGECHRKGEGVEQNLVLAVQCYGQAAALGHEDAMYNMVGPSIRVIEDLDPTVRPSATCCRVSLWDETQRVSDKVTVPGCVSVIVI